MWQIAPCLSPTASDLVAVFGGSLVLFLIPTFTRSTERVCSTHPSSLPHEVTEKQLHSARSVSLLHKCKQTPLSGLTGDSA